MSHEGERATGYRIEDQPERAPPHWLNPLCSACAADRSLLIVHGRVFRLSSVAALAKASNAGELGSGMGVSR